jgi:dUTP pyrophosphatase
MQIQLKLLRPDAKVPVRATAHAAAYDLFANEPIILKDGQSVEVGTGLAMAIPENYVLLVFSRSGHGFKYDVTLANSVGVIDADYRGELRLKLTKPYSAEMSESDPDRYFYLDSNKAVAQIMLVERFDMTFNLTDELPETSRGEGGFGHTDNLA